MIYLVEKNKEYILDIIAEGYQGEGIAKVDGYPIFIKGAIKGEKAKIKIIKVNKNYAYGRLQEIIEVSEDRVKPTCSYYKRCGGCSLQHMNYNKQLDFKWNRVKDCIGRIGGVNEELVEYPIGMGDNQYRYRNKVQLPIGKVNGEIVIGFFAERSHDIIDIDECLIQFAEADSIRKITKEWIVNNNIEPATVDGRYNPSGVVRHIVIRKGFTTDEIMVVLVVNSENVPHLDEYIDSLKNNIPALKSVVLNINAKDTNVILGDKCITIYGSDTIQDYIDKFKFNISPLSFFQVNPKQTEVLYNKALEYAELTGNEVVFDAYCGTGTITLFLSQKAKKVYGVEIIDAAIVNARENARINGIDNCEFFTGKSEEIIPQLLKEGVNPDVIMVDPPRKGCDISLLQAIIDCNIAKVVYVSCDPSTLGRDLKILSQNGYKVKKVQPVDMFGGSFHIESVALLVKER